MNCNSCRSEFADYLFESESNERRSSIEAHLATCKVCSHELAELRGTIDLLDVWKAPEPSPYFDQKLAVMLREEQQRPTATWLEKLQERLLLNTGRHFRPAMAGALGLAVALGGGSFAGSILLRGGNPQVQASAAVNDLQILDKNDQAIQQMDQLLQDDGDTDPATNGQPAS